MDVDLYADPSCPWSWAAYLWLDNVAARRQLRLTVQPFSLLLRDGTQNLAPDRRAAREQTHRALRVVSAIPAPDRRSAFFAAVTAPLYGGGEARLDIDAAVLAAGLDPALAGCADDAGLDGAISDTMQALDALLPARAAGAQRIPVIVLHTHEGPIVWEGPLLDPPPRGRAALHLWDTAEQLLQIPGLYGLGRPRPTRHSLLAAAAG
jgi:hypothetical protein